MTAALDRDPAVPQRDLLLDPVVGRRAPPVACSDADGPLRIDDCRQVRVKYRVGARLRVRPPRSAWASASFDVAASTFPTLERSERAYAQCRARAVPAARLRPVAHDRELATVFWTFPNDRKIGHLPALAGPAPELARAPPRWARSAARRLCAGEGGDGPMPRRGRAHGRLRKGVCRRRRASAAPRVHEALTRALPADDP